MDQYNGQPMPNRPPQAPPPERFLEQQLPPQYRPLGAWAYFGYTLLFSIPIVGFICLIVFSCSSSNINRRNFARSFWCVLVLAILIFALLAALGVLAYLPEIIDV